MAHNAFAQEVFCKLQRIFKFILHVYPGACTAIMVSLDIPGILKI
ncbi:hypothetical protein SOVF_210820 [Spinacia oleracea]|nr:hypothetical protein SOVF_210820 [Spinacia oleracea]